MSRIKVVLLIALSLFLITSGVLASTVIKVSAGYSHTAVMMNDGTVWTWGDNGYGQLGDGTTIQRLTPVKVTGLTGVVSISACGHHTVVLKNDGTVWAWGYNNYGQLGDGTTTNKPTPVKVSGLTGVSAISAGDNHTVALKNDGTVWTWGRNINGQLGDATTTARSAPVKVTGLSGVVAVSAGYNHTVVLKSDGTMRAWGNNSNGQLGIGNTAQKLSPVQVTGLSGVVAVSAGESHTVALKNDGTVWAWGYNFYGQLGDMTATQRSTPVQALGLTGVSAISAGGSHTVVLKNDGTVWIWGDNGYGQLGNGIEIGRWAPGPVSGLDGLAAVSAGYGHTAVLKNDGTVWTWGRNSNGQLGDGTIVDRSTPVYVFDQIPPSGTVVVNDGAAYTNSTSVNLSLAATDDSGTVSQMKISNDGVFDTETWETYSTTKSWTLTSGDGVKTVYIKFKDAAGNESDVTSDTIVIETVPPEAFTPVATPSGWTEGDVTATFSTTDALSGMNHYEVSLDGGAFITAASPYIVSIEGIHNVQVKAVDNVGNSRISPQVLTYITRTPTAISISSPYRNGRQIYYKVSYDRAAEITLTAADVTLNKTGTADGTISVSITGDETRLVTISDITGDGTLGISIAAGTAVDVLEHTAPAAGPSATIQIGTDIIAVSAGYTHTVALKSDGTVWDWGRNNYGQLGDGTAINKSAPIQVSGLAGVVAVSAGETHTVALKNDGTVWAWGRNNCGQLGDGTRIDRLTPIQVSGLAGVSAISAGNYHTVALKNDGTVWDWGCNNYGQLGDGTTVNRYTPVQVSGLTGVIAVSACEYYTAVLKDDGTVWTWGFNLYGQLGDGTYAQRSTPVKVTGLTGVVAVSAGSDHIVALKNDGTVWDWGYNYYGELGDGTTTKRPTPGQVTGLTGVVAVSAGYWHTTALKNDGTMWTWGSNTYGKLGDGTTTDRLTPVQVSGLTGVVAISASAFHTSALKNDGTVWDWGYNGYGQLGDGTEIQRLVPVNAVFDQTPPINGTVVINSDAVYTNSTSVNLSLAATDDSGTVGQMKISNDGVFDTETWETYSATKSWTLTSGDGPKTVYIKFSDKAYNESDVTSDSIILDTTPPEVFTPVASPSEWTEGDVTVTFSTTDALSGMSHYEVSLDNGAFVTAASPYVVSTEGNHLVQVKAVDNAGNIRMQQVNASISRTSPAISISSPHRSDSQIIYTVSYERAVEITLTAADITLNKTGTADGTISVSGTGNETRLVTISDISGEGTLGISIAAGTASDAFGRTALSAGPSDTINTVLYIVAIATGDLYTVALRNDGTVWDWGYNDCGLLGDGTTTTRLTPLQVSGLTGVVAISAGETHTVALKNDGTVWDWGYNNCGQLGDGTTTNRYTPVQVSALTGVAAIAAGRYHTIAIKSDGTVWSWGDNTYGQLGDGTTTYRSTPVQVSSLTGVVAASAGYWHTVALKNDGTVWAWGRNDNGALGDGTTTQRLTPVQITGLTGVAAVSAGGVHTVAVKSDGTVWAWGWNYYGQLGDGTTINRLTPLQVSGLTGVVAVSAGETHTVALKNDGTVWDWGQNNWGQLGDGTILSYRSTPVQVSALTGVAAVSAGGAHTVALKNNGSMCAWGSNYYGQLGDGTTINRSTPVNVVFDWIPPTGTIAINSGAVYATSTSVTLCISAADVSGTIYQMRISNDGVFDTEPWETYSTSKSWTLISGDGPKTVYIKFNDKAFNESDVTSDTIVLDSTPPEAFIPVASTSGWTEDNVTVTFSTTDALSGINHYEVALDYGAFATAASPYVVSNEGNHTVYVKAVDNAGNIRTSQVNACISRSAPAVSISKPIRNGGQISFWVSYERAAEITLTAADITLNKTGTANGTVSVSSTGNEARIVTISDISGEGTLGISIAAGTASDVFGRIALSAGPSDTFNTMVDIVVASAGGYHTVALRNDGIVRVWGDNNDSQLGDGTTTDKYTPIQVSGLTGVAAVSAGGSYTVALKSDGTVWDWGRNYEGQLGDGTTVYSRSTPLQVSGLTGVTAVAPGYYHTVVLKDDGTAWTWGRNYYGQLGDETTNDGFTPGQVSGLTGVVAITAGEYHTVALKNDGTVWAWGYNKYGQLGDGTTTDRLAPVQVSGLSGVIAISAGALHTVALKNDGTLWTWGHNIYGQLGDGTKTDRSTPVQVSGLTGVVAISARGDHTVALKGDSTVWAWGWNYYGQLGDGTKTDRSTPVKVTGLTGVAAVSAGIQHTVALKNDATVWTWGDNSSGQLGDGTTKQRLTPVKAVFDWTSPTNGTVDINNGAAYTNSPIVPLNISATDDSGIIYQMKISNDGIFDTEIWTAYSTNMNWRLPSGDGSKTVYIKFKDKAENESDVTSDTIVLDTVPPEAFTAAATPSGWTEGDVAITFSTTDALSGMSHYEVSLDGGAFVTATSPYVVNTEGNHVVQVKAVDNAGNIRTSQVNACISRSAPAISISSPYRSSPYRNGTQISYKVSYEHAVEINLTAADITLNKTGTVDGTVSVSGTGNETRIVTISDVTGEGTLGISIAAGTASDAFGRIALSAGPSATFKTGMGIVAASTGGYHTIALKDDGTVWTWGDNYYGQLGDGTTTDKYTPIQVSGLTGVVAVSAGGFHTVVLKDDGTVWTWGCNIDGQLGDGTKIDRYTPLQVSGLTGVVAIYAGAVHTVAVKNDGTVWTWGCNIDGQLGDGTKTNRYTPLQVSGLTGVVAVSASYHTVVMKNDGTVWAWGRNDNGALGDGTTTDRLAPVQVTGLTGVVAVSAGVDHTVAVKNDGTVWAWGGNYYGQLGDGTTTQKSTPVQVSGLTGVAAVSTSFMHTAAVKNDGTVWVWGDNSHSQLGDGVTSQYKSTPVQVPGLTGVVAVAAGYCHTVAVKNDDTVWTWGYNIYGQLGNGTTTQSLTPVNVVFDLTPPTGTVAINSDATYTNSTSVTLAISATDVSGTISQMKISNDGVFDTETWEAYSTTKSWILTSGDGVKTVSIKFKDAAGNESDVTTDSIVFTTTGAVSASTAKGSADGTFVYVDRAIVSASFDGFFYIESDKRESGIRVEMAGHTLSVGMRADISGTMNTNSNGERYILTNTAVQSTPPNNTGSVMPLGIVNRMFGGGNWSYQPGTVWPETLSGQIGVIKGYGINNIGLLVRTWGHVTEYEQVQDPAKPAWFIIDDGSGTPVKCIIPRDVVFDKSWSYITVTGVSSCEKVGDELHRVLLIRPGDVIGHN